MNSIPPNGMDDLNQLNQQITDLLSQRDRIAESRQSNGEKVSDPRQFQESKTSQPTNVVGQNSKPNARTPVCCLGPTASFTHLAALRYFGPQGRCELVGDVKQVFERLIGKEVEFGLVAIENSNSGQMGENIDLLYPNMGFATGFDELPLCICGEQRLRIEHSLVSSASDISSLETIYTHIQGKKQCLESLQRLEKELGRKLKIVDQASTSEAARKASEDTSGSVAAIAHRLTAEVHKLNILQDHFEDDVANFTRFVVIGRKPPGRTGRDRTSVWLRLKDESGSLATATESFKQQKLNMTNLISRPVRGEPFTHSFFIEIEGHIEDDSVRHALNDIGTNLTVLGSYPQCRDYERGITDGLKLQPSPKTNRTRHPDSRRKAPPLPQGVSGPLTIGIIGIEGQYGQWLKRFFEQKFDYNVIGADKVSPKGLSNQEVVRQSDVVIFSVSLNHADAVIRELVEESHENQLWMDITSVKRKPIAAMLNSNAEVIGLHPMCAPSVDSWRGQPINVCPVRCPRWLDWLTTVLQVSEAKVEFTGAESHDRRMALLQVLPHALYLSAVGSLRQMDADVNELLRSATPTYRMMWYGMNRYLSNHPELCADLQLENAESALETLDAIHGQIGKIRDWIASGDRRSIIEFIEDSQDFVGSDHREQASRRFSEFIRINTDLEDENSIEIYKLDRGEFDRAGLLKEAVDLFATFAVNLTSLHSFSSGERQYRFRVGTALRRDDEVVQKVIAALRERGWTVE